MQGSNQSFAGIGVCGSAAPIPKKVPQVESAADDLGNAIDRVGDRIGVLASRLGLVLAQATDLVEANSPGETDYATPLAANLQREARRLRHIESVVNDLLERLEV